MVARQHALSFLPLPQGALRSTLIALLVASRQALPQPHELAQPPAPGAICSDERWHHSVHRADQKAMSYAPLFNPTTEKKREARRRKHRMGPCPPAPSWLRVTPPPVPAFGGWETRRAWPTAAPGARNRNGRTMAGFQPYRSVRVSRDAWCRRRDSNPYGVAPSGF